MANLITEHDILSVLERGCWHSQLNGICGLCREDVRRWVLGNTGFPLRAEPATPEKCHSRDEKLCMSPYCYLMREHTYGECGH